MRPEPKTSPCVRCGHPAFPWSAGDAPLCAKCIVDGVDAIEADDPIVIGSFDNPPMEPGEIHYIDDPMPCDFCKEPHAVGARIKCARDFPFLNGQRFQCFERNGRMRWRVIKGDLERKLDADVGRALIVAAVVLSAIWAGLMVWWRLP